MGDALLVVDANGAYARMFGDANTVIVAEDTLGRPLPPEAQPQCKAAAGILYSLAFTTTAADGTRHSFEATKELIRTDGAERGGVVTIRDLGDRSLRPLQDEFNNLVEAHRGAYRSHPPRGKAQRSPSGSHCADQRPLLAS